MENNIFDGRTIHFYSMKFTITYYEIFEHIEHRCDSPITSLRTILNGSYQLNYSNILIMLHATWRKTMGNNLRFPFGQR